VERDALDRSASTSVGCRNCLVLTSDGDWRAQGQKWLGWPHLASMASALSGAKGARELTALGAHSQSQGQLEQPDRPVGFRCCTVGWRKAQASSIESKCFIKLKGGIGLGARPIGLAVVVNHHLRTAGAPALLAFRGPRFEGLLDG